MTRIMSRILPVGPARPPGRTAMPVIYSNFALPAWLDIPVLYGTEKLQGFMISSFSHGFPCEPIENLKGSLSSESGVERKKNGPGSITTRMILPPSHVVGVFGETLRSR